MSVPYWRLNNATTIAYGIFNQWKKAECIKDNSLLAIRNAYEDLLSYLVKKAPCFIEIAGYRVIEWVHEAG